MGHGRASPSLRRGFAATALLSILLPATGCGRPPEPPRFVRLVDAAATATIHGRVALDAADDPFAPPAEVLAERALAPVAADPAGARELAALARSLAPRADAMAAPGQPDALVAGIDTDGARRLRVEVHGAGDHGLAFALEQDRRAGDSGAADPGRLQKTLLGRRSFLRWLEPAGDGTGVLRADLEADAATRSLLVVALGAGGARVTVQKARPTDGLQLLPRVPGCSPWVRTAAVHGEHRESLVLPPPAEARFRFVLPREGPVLRAGVANYLAGPAAANVLEVTAHGRGQALEARVECAGVARSWRPFELDLGPLAGQEIELVLRATAAAAGEERGALLVGSPVVVSAGARTGSGAPDVVVISLDTVRADRLSLFDPALATSPALAAARGASFVFTSAVAPAPWTLPSHVSLFSGQYPDRHGAFRENSRIHAETPLLAEDFRRAGYETVAFSGGGYVSPDFGFARGFERYGVEDPAYPDRDWARARGESALIERAERSAEARAALLELLQGPRDRPLFLFVHTYAAHNYAAPEAVLRELGAAPDEIPDLLQSLTLAEVNRLLGESPAAAEVERVKARARRLYDASVRVADDLCSDVFAAIDAAGRTGSTLVVVVSDHGEELFERGAIGHGKTVTEELLHVPLLFRGPGVAAGRSADSAVSLVDVAPTVRELCGLPAPAPGDAAAVAVDGRSLAAALAGRDAAAVAVLARGETPAAVQHALRTGRTKLVATEVLLGDTTFAWFDLRDDPGETEDLAPRRAAEAARLGASLQQWVGDLRRAGPEGADAGVTPDTLDRLRELGYLDG